MNDTVIRVEALCKEYRLGVISHGTLYKDVQSRWARFMGREDPNAKIALSPSYPNCSINERFWALRNVSFDVNQGEIVGIIGRNGAGKSTLLKIVSRITAPTSGSVKIKGRVASLLEVGTGFHPELTGRENVFLNGAILGMRKGEIEEKFADIVKFAEIEKFIDTPVKRYSSGMYVRLAFAVAAHLDPEILLVDEVLAVGDANFQRKCLGKMSEVARGGRTILFVSHQMSAVENLCSRAILFDAGQITADGPSSEVIQSYLNRPREIQDAVFDVSSNQERSGTGEYLCTKAWLTTQIGDAVLGFGEGEENAVFHILIEPTTKFPIKKTIIASICVRDAFGYRLFTMASDLLNREFPIEGSLELCWIMKKVQLTEGNYICDINVVDSPTRSPIDYVLNAFELEIFPRDYFESGRSQVKGLDKFYINFDVMTNRDR